VPIVASRIGTLPDIIEDGITGILFNPGDVSDLAAKVRWVRNCGDAVEQIARNGRARYETEYTADRNYERLVEIYCAAQRAGGQTSSPSVEPVSV
jgi:glycosyltransferase involved in cell wall biosynthesis